MRRISIDNPRLENTYITDLAADYISGTAIVVRSNNSFANNDLAVFGNAMEELAESKKISSLSGSTGFVLPSDLKFAHDKGTPVFKTLWDFVTIEADYGSGWTIITDSPMQWDSDTNKTIFFDPNGTGATSYRFRFHNSAINTYSEYSPTLSGAGYAKNQMGYIIREAREIAGDVEGKILNTTECLRILTRAKNIVRANNARYWFWKVDGFNSLKTILATNDTRVFDLSSIENIGPLDGIEYRLVQGASDQKWELLRISDAEMRAKTRYTNMPATNYPRTYRLLPPDDNSLKGYFEIDYQIADNNVGTFYVSYYMEEPDYDSVDDTTKIIMPELLQDYLISKIYARKGNETLATEYYEQFTGPAAKKKTEGIQDLTGIALLDSLDIQYKRSQGQPMQLKRFRGQKAMSRLYGNRGYRNTDQEREDFFDRD